MCTLVQFLQDLGVISCVKIGPCVTMDLYQFSLSETNTTNCATGWAYISGWTLALEPVFMTTYKHDGRDVEIPPWLDKMAAQDPKATAETLWKMRDIWPPDFIEALRPTEFSFALDLSALIALRETSDS